ncbi:MAG: hypothetical protein A2096_11120 [Spirochaetes bacterium GWF1_41_5]|nr:MAG: hypothetical protein A2096_11120 [Spirochaetes bacterium GWF1_41_5]
MSNGTQEKKEFWLVLYIRTLQKYKPWIITPGALAMLAASALMYLSVKLPPEKSFYPDMYTSTARIYIINNPGDGVSGLLSKANPVLQDMTGINIFGNNTAEMIVEILKSRKIYNYIATEYNLPEKYNIPNMPLYEIRRIFQKHFSVSRDKKTGIISISYSSIDPVLSRNIVNSAIAALESELKDSAKKIIIEEIDYLDNTVSKLAEKILLIESAMTGMEKNHGALVNIKDQAAAFLNKSESLKEQIAAKELEYKTMIQISGTTNEMTSLLKMHIANLKEAEKELERQISKKDISGIGLQYLGYKRDLMIYEKMFSAMSTQCEMAKLQGGRNYSQFRILEYGDVPEIKSGPYRGKTVIVIGFLCVSVCIILVLLYHGFILTRR